MITHRQKQISACLVHFIDRAYYPDYQPTIEDWQDFFNIETNGRLQTSANTLEKIKPLLEAKGDYELQIKMIYSEVAEWWAEGTGWIYPIDAAIRESKETPELAPYTMALEKISDAFRTDPVKAISTYSGFSVEERNKYLKRHDKQSARAMAKTKNNHKQLILS